MIASSDDSTIAASVACTFWARRVGGDVACDLGNRDDAAGFAHDRRDRYRDVDPPTVFANAFRLEMLDPLAAPERREDDVLLVPPVLGDEDQDRQAQDLVLTPPEDALGRAVPEENRPVDVLRDDGVFRGVDEGREQAADRLDVAQEKRGCRDAAMLRHLALDARALVRFLGIVVVRHTGDVAGIVRPSQGLGT